ncbi:DUF429 domain-containing protein [Occallatibacter savannae]|uniref:DUF429 domain-containing protein n=1 Tax=Occallatibacter savannae TaxID=1002691 RepID=UPI000D686BC6|nr:DUF429 domain-containing protein [Occallatibacter savannae]
MRTPERFVAVDWSGSAHPAGQRKHIWTSVAGEGAFSGFTRAELSRWIVETFAGQPAVIGLDFAFSFPVAFFRDRHLSTVGELWRAAEVHGETWLRQCEPPFWGRPGRKCPPGHAGEGFRRTDREIRVAGISPKSPLQIGGAGAVGTGSIRGMPVLRQLRSAGFSIWPFDPPSLPLILEIYPRLLTGPVNKSHQSARAAYLNRSEFQSLSAEDRLAAEGSEDAFDAIVSALRMRACAAQFPKLRQADDATELLEGRIWTPELAV